MDKEDIKTCKEEAENYIEFMKTAGDNAGWTRGLMWYIQHLEQKELILDKVTEKLSKMKQSIEKLKNRDGESMLMVDVCIQNIIAFYDDIEKIF